MKTTFTPEHLFIQANILFIANKDLSDFLTSKTSKEQRMISLDSPSLWELQVDESNNKKLLLHLDLPYYSEPITINFKVEQLILVEQNQEFDTLGILLGFDEETGEAESILFILSIDQGLKNIL